MNRIINALKADIRFQFKQGFYYVYAAITLLYIVIFLQIPKEALSYVLPAAIFSDPSLLGFIFIGAIFLLEKNQGIFQYLSITPLRLNEYIISKICSLAILGLSVSFLLAISMGISFNPLILFFGCALSSAFFTLVGIYAVCGCKSVNQFFGVIVLYSLVLLIPIIAMFSIPYTDFLKVFPTYAGVRLIYGAYSGISFFEALYCSLNLIIFTFAVYLLTVKKIRKKLYYGGKT